MFTRTSKKKPMLIFDIGSTSVGAALVLVGGNEPPFFAHTARHWLPPVREINMARLLGLLETAVDSVGKDMVSLGVKRLAALGYGSRLPAEVHYFVAAPWYASHISTVGLLSEKPFMMTREFLARAVERERKALEETIAGTAPGLRIFEHQILSLSANGYETENPFGKNVSDAELCVYAALAEEAVLGRFTSRIQRSFHTETVEPHSFLLAFFSCVRDIPGGGNDFLLVDVSGEVTEVSIVKDGRLRESASYPLGRNFLARSLAAACGVSCQEALSLLAVHFSRRGNEDFSKKFMPAVSRVEKEWMNGFEECLSRVAGEAFVPHVSFLAAPSEMSPWIAAAIQDEALYQHTLASKPFVVSIADEKMFDAHVGFGPGVSKDSFLMVDALFLNKIKM